MARVHSGEEILPDYGAPTLQTDDRQTDLRQQRPERNVVRLGQKCRLDLDGKM